MFYFANTWEHGVEKNQVKQLLTVWVYL